MKKAMSLLLALLLVVALFAGCGDKTSSSKSTADTGSGDAKTSSTAKTDSDEPVTLQVAVSGSAQELQIHQDKFDAYTKEHPNVTIEPVDIGDDRMTKLMTLMGSNTLPDIVYINEWCYVLAEKNVLEPLDDYIARDGYDTSVFPESLLVPLRYEDKLYAFPTEISPYCMYYNKDMFEEAGLDLPTDDWTTEEFYEAAKTLANPDEKVYGFILPGNWADQTLNWMCNFGVDFDISGTEQKGMETPEALEALQFMYDMSVTDAIAPSPATLTALGQGSDVLFRNEKAAMCTWGLWMLPQFKADPLPFEWDVVRLPMGKTNNCKAGVLNWGIAAQSKHKDAAWDLLQGLVNSESMSILAEAGMALPASTDEAANQIVLDTKFPNNVKAFIDSVPACDLKDELSSHRTEVNTALTKVTDEMMNGGMTPEEAQKKIVEDINAILAG